MSSLISPRMQAAVVPTRARVHLVQKNLPPHRWASAELRPCTVRAAERVNIGVSYVLTGSAPAGSCRGLGAVQDSHDVLVKVAVVPGAAEKVVQ